MIRGGRIGGFGGRLDRAPEATAGRPNGWASPWEGQPTPGHQARPEVGGVARPKNCQGATLTVLCEPRPHDWLLPELPPFRSSLPERGCVFPLVHLSGEHLPEGRVVGTVAQRREQPFPVLSEALDAPDKLQSAGSLAVEAVSGSLRPKVARAPSQILHDISPRRAVGRTGHGARGCLMPYGHIQQPEYAGRVIQVAFRCDRSARFWSPL